jgi:1,4-dihydroxy-2-naphthoate octaprenyltransferase
MTETNVEQKSSNTYLILAIGVLLAGIIMFYYFSDIRLFYRVLGMISVLTLSGYIGYQNHFGNLCSPTV